MGHVSDHCLGSQAPHTANVEKPHHNINIDGGDGYDTLVVTGTELNDDFIITKDGVFGAGLPISFSAIEKLIHR